MLLIFTSVLVFNLGGYFLTVSPDSALEIAKHAAQENKHFTMNLSAPFIPQFFTKAVMDLAPYWDVLFGNESEALAYAKANFYETTDIAEIALLVSNLPKINDKRPRVVVFTHGDKPTVIATQGKTSFYPVIPIAEKDIVDTNGAGDAFCGGFMSQYVLGKSLKDCCNAGHYVANVVIQRHGPSYPEEKGVFVASDY